MMLVDDLRSGFVLAHHHPGLVLFDVLWKAVWLVLTMAALFLVAAWISTDLRGIAWEDTGVRALNGLIAVALMRDFWNLNREGILLAATILLVVSLCGWFFLEALFRTQFVGAGFMPAGIKIGAAGGFRFLLLSNLAKSLILVAAGFLLIPVAFAGAATIAGLTFLALGFLLTLLDTVIRANAVDLLGTDLFRVAGLLGILMLFELMIGASVVILLFTGLLRIGRPMDVVAMLVAAGVVVVLLNLLHSYLLLVRFSTIAIMRQNVIEV